MMMGPEPRIRILEMSVRFGIYFLFFHSVILITLSSRPSAMIGEADHCARGGTCFCRTVPAPQANSRSLDCEDRPLRGRSFSLGMTDLRGSRLELLHHLHEILEQIMRIMRPGRRLRVVLDAEQREV